MRAFIVQVRNRQVVDWPVAEQGDGGEETDGCYCAGVGR